MTKNSPLISVVIPVYNEVNYLNECVDSLVMQEFQDCEIILVDDGSTNEAAKICDNYAELYENIFVVHKKNGGLVSARQVGTNMARGEYISHIDSDDFVSKDYFEVIRNAISTHNNPDIITFDYCEYPSKKTIVKHNSFKPGYYDKKNIEKCIFPYLIHSKSINNFPQNICFKVFKKDLYSKYSCVDQKITIGEDLVVTIPCVANAENLVIVDDVLYFYRNNMASMTKQNSPYDINYPLLIHNSLIGSINISESDFEAQLSRLDVRNIFNSFYSQFYSNKKYCDIVKILKKRLNIDVYNDAITRCKFGSSFILNFMKFTIKYRLFLLIKIYSIMYKRLR